MHSQTALIRVMLVDDHKTMLWGLHRLIEGAQTGMEVVGSATSCAEARAQLDACTPDVVLLDLDLDGHSSLELLPELLAAGARVLVFTGARDQALLDRAVRDGARGLLQKDAPAETLLEAIAKVHAGDMWIDHAVMTRLLSEMQRPAALRKPDADAVKLASLTQREHKIIQAIVQGNGALNRSLAQNLFISEHTLRNHLVSIYKKLDVANRLELYVYAVKHELGTEDPDPVAKK
jgi:two-component system nitrate/nitrite response regulator NarL